MRCFITLFVGRRGTYMLHTTNTAAQMRGDTRVMQPVKPAENVVVKKKARRASGVKKHWKLILVTALGVYCAVSLAMQLSTLKNINTDKQTLNEQLSDLQQQQAFLESELEYIGTDEYVERYAREKLGWVYSDEIVYKDKEAEASQAQADDSASANPAASEQPLN